MKTALYKIVHIIDNLNLGGAETLLFSTIKRLPQFEHHIIILTPRIQIVGIEKFAQIHCLYHYGWFNTLRTCKKIKRVVAELNPYIVHSHLFLSSFLTRFALGTQYRLAYSIHNLYGATIFTKPHTRLIERMTFNQEHQLIAVSNYVLENYKKVVTNCKKGKVLYNFIDDVFIDNEEIKKRTSAASLQKWVAVGSLKSQKNYLQILSLFQTLYNSSTEKHKLSLDIYGDGALREELEIKIKSLALPIYLKGNVNGIETVLSQYDAYISASLYEGYGIAPMEALAIGLPVFLSNIPVYKEIYSNYAFFFNLEKESDVTFKKSCEVYLSMSFKEKTTLLKQSQEYAAIIANGNSYIQRLLEIYQVDQKIVTKQRND